MTYKIAVGVDENDYALIMKDGELLSWSDVLHLLDMGRELLAIIKSSGYDVSPCMTCGEPIVCIPDGMPCCDACGKKELAANT